MTKTQAKSLARAFVDRFGGKTEFEEVVPGRYRFGIVSRKFNSMPHMKRQDQVWEVVDALLDRETTLDVSMILAYAPKDLVLPKSPRKTVVRARGVAR